MTWNTFVRSAGFAAVAAAGWFPWALVTAPLVGGWNARAVYLTVVTIVYVAGLAPSGARRIRSVVAAILATAVLACVVRSSGELCIGLAMTLGLARSVFLFPSPAVRAVALEAVCLVGGLLFARFLAGPTLSATGLAVWGFLLVQSLFFLVPSRGGRAPSGQAGDPFEDAHRRALALLERAGA